jgi:hypothetical protein
LSSAPKDSTKTSSTAVSIPQGAAEQRIKQLETENEQLLKKLQGRFPIFIIKYCRNKFNKIVM